ncbi:hypothetical protein PR202_ga22804 [Eleusine coracana subsp. coracana]|uniref:Uncharacterized protein n=1 Tax=Eleusine coracana subsp. coracana TaxID=191504 RepID=A0AAV5D470_ELECO|nr:hypothetical protein PR202_ga22804 [Eleusine coracana subsp. coracana]
MYGSNIEEDKIWKLAKQHKMSENQRGGVVDKDKAASSSTASSRGALRRSVSGRLATAAKEQKARLYIMRRCVSMLVRWKD